jgi:hypothetical protein
MCNDVIPGILKDGLRVQGRIPIDQSFRMLSDACLCCLGDRRSPELSRAQNARFGECLILCGVLPFYLLKSLEVMMIHDELRVCVSALVRVLTGPESNRIYLERVITQARTVRGKSKAMILTEEVCEMGNHLKT